MTEQSHDPADAATPDPATSGRPSEAEPRTGVAAVDDVLDRLAAVEDRPVEEHVAAFERAHEDLRRALDSAGSA
jgi:hypothetical protein